MTWEETAKRADEAGKAQARKAGGQQAYDMAYTVTYGVLSALCETAKIWVIVAFLQWLGWL